MRPRLTRAFLQTRAARAHPANTQTHCTTRNPKSYAVSVVAWFNGGPGCSSMEGALSESGLYRIDQFSSPPTLSQNPWSWGNISNNLFIEAPAGVGFSYCSTAAGCQHTDTTTANDNLNAIISFFAAYPELQGNDFFIAGESYAGVYVPSLAYAIYNYNQAGSGVKINLKGIMVGNGCIGNSAGHCGNDPTGLNDYHDVMYVTVHTSAARTSPPLTPSTRSPPTALTAPAGSGRGTV